MSKPRVLISTDMGGADSDDTQSMVHALLYGDKVQLEGLVSTPTAHGGRAAHINKAIDAYAKDYGKLKTWSSDYASPEYLKGIVAQGAINPSPSKGWSSPSEGSKAIIKAAHESNEPLWVLNWGAMTDLAQALHDDPSIQSKIKVFSLNGWNGTQDPHAREYIYNNFKNLWWIESKSTHRGMYVDDSGMPNNAWKMSDAVGHGALGDFFYNARPYGLKMGDTPSLLYLLDKSNDLNPAADSWGGSFVKTGHGPNFWTDSPAPSLKNGPYNGAESVQRHQSEIYKDFAAHLDRAKFANSKGASNSDDPVVANNDAASAMKSKPIVINVLQNDKAADGGLKLAGADDASAKGGKIVVNGDGTVTFTPKAGYVGNDSFSYTARDADGDTDRASVAIAVKDAAAPNKPAPAKPAVPADRDGSGNPVIGVNDHYKIDAGDTLWFNTRYLTWNDKGADGGLKVIDVADRSKAGVKVSWDANGDSHPAGTTIYQAKPGFQGTDRIDYVVRDKDGSTDVASVMVTVGKDGTIKPAPEPVKQPAAKPAPEPGEKSGGGGKAVTAMDDTRKLNGHEDLYIDPKYLLGNDKAPDGGLKLVSVDKVSKAGFEVEWQKGGPVVYDPSDWYNGVDRFDYTAMDKDGSLDRGTVFVHVGDTLLS